MTEETLGSAFGGEMRAGKVGLSKIVKEKSLQNVTMRHIESLLAISCN